MKSVGASLLITKEGRGKKQLWRSQDLGIDRDKKFGTNAIKTFFGKVMS